MGQPRRHAGGEGRIALAPLPPGLQSLIDDLSLYDDRADRIEALIEIGQRYSHDRAADVPRTEDRRVPGCESEVFVAAGVDQSSRLALKFAVDNPQGISAMALAMILEDSLGGQPAALAADVPEDVVYTIFGSELSMGKSMGLTNMVRMVKASAKAGRPN